MKKRTKIILPLISILIVLMDAKAALSQCSIGVTGLSFGNYDVFLITPTDTTGTITVNCAADVNKANVSLGVSLTSGTFNPRRMKRSGGNDLLNYNIYTDVTRTVLFGDGSGGTSYVELKRKGKSEPWGENIVIYGRIPPGQDVSVGLYSDTLAASVNP